MSDAYFTPTDDPERFEATGYTEGLWEPGMQHAGPAAALLARAVERLPCSVDGAAQVARLTVEILGPVPIGEVTVAAGVVRPGRSVELVEAELRAGGRPAMRARAWRIRTASLVMPNAGPVVSEPPALPPEPTPWRRHEMRRGFLGAVEWRFVSGHFEEPGPAVVWGRHLVPLVAGEDPSGLQRLIPFADCGNGLSGVYDFDAWWFINTELTVHVQRVPAGDWFCVRAATALDGSGVGLAETELYDQAGRVGRGAQSLLVGPRR
jgi:hypothetical protein